jgi:hypothetical protein
MVKRWNRPRTVSVLRAAFRAGSGDRLTLPMMLTWSKWGAVDRAGRGEVREGPRSASPSQRSSPDCCWALSAATSSRGQRARRHGPPWQHHGAAGGRHRTQRDREPVCCSAGSYPPAGHRDHEPIGPHGGLAPNQTGAAARRAARDSQPVGTLWLAAGTGPWPGQLACSWCDRMAGSHLRRHGRLPAAAACAFQGQLRAGEQTGDS